MTKTCSPKCDGSPLHGIWEVHAHLSYGVYMILSRIRERRITDMCAGVVSTNIVPSTQNCNISYKSQELHRAATERQVVLSSLCFTANLCWTGEHW